MITPKFVLEQDDDFVIVRINLPHARLDDGEFHIDGRQFRFHLRPYFLRLTFRHELAEDGRERAAYDWDTRVLTVHLPKATPGERFGGLQLLTELLRPARAPLPPRIEVLGGTPAAAAEGAPGADEADDDDDDDDDDDGAEWEVEQRLDEGADGGVGVALGLGTGGGYGFDRAYARVFAQLPAEEALLLCAQPEASSAAERRAERLEMEAAAYDDEHYTADLLNEEDEIEPLLRYQPWWAAEAARAAPSAAGAGAPAAGAPAAGAPAACAEAGAGAEDEDGPVRLDEAERERLRRLRPREHALSAREARTAVPNALVDLLYAHCHDVRSSGGEGTCESAWSVARLSASISHLERFGAEPADEVAVSCVRRALVFPLHRHWRLALAVLADVADVLELGAPAVLRCLLRVHALLERADGYAHAHVHNELWTEHLIAWVQRGASRASLRALGARVRAARVEPEHMPPHFFALRDVLGAAAPAARSSTTDSDDDSDDDDSSGSGSDSDSDSDDECGEGAADDGVEAPPAADGAQRPRRPLITELPPVGAAPAPDEVEGEAAAAQVDHTETDAAAGALARVRITTADHE